MACLRFVAKPARDLLSRSPGRIDIGLNLNQSDRTFRQGPVFVENGVLAVFPALIDEPLVVLPRIFDETIAVAIAIAFDPFERRADMRPQLTDGLEVAGPLEIGSGEHNEERRCVDAAVVAPERHFSESRHLAMARLMQDFARLRVRDGIGVDGLHRGEALENASGDRRIEPQSFESRDDPVPPEYRAKPGNAGVRIRAFGEVRLQHIKIGDAAASRLIEDMVRGFNRSGLRGCGSQRATRIPERCEERSRWRRRQHRFATVNFDEKRLALAWRQIEFIDRLAWSEPLGLGVEPERRRPFLTIKPKITEHHF